MRIFSILEIGYIPKGMYTHTHTKKMSAVNAVFVVLWKFKKLNQFSPYKIQFDLHLSLNADVPDLLMDEDW